MLIKDSVRVLDKFLVPDDVVTVYYFASTEQQAERFDMHYALEFGIVLSGRERRQFGGQSQAIGPGEVWFHGVWEPHGVEVLEMPTTSLVFAVSPRAMAAVGADRIGRYDWMAPFAAPPAERPQASPSTRDELLTLAAAMLPRVTDGSEQAKLWGWLCLLEMMLLVRAAWAPPTARGPVADPSSYERLDRAVDLVLSSRYPVSLQQAARLCGLNPNSFNRLFKELMGMTFAKYCLRHRLSGGAGQLARTTDTVQVIAKEWGFADASHFHRCFQSQFGCTPAQYRDQRQAPPERCE
jgi:AraC-like DNA-binding protein